MKLEYGSFAYFLYPGIFIAIVVGLAFLLRKRSNFIKKVVVVTFAMMNLLQHLLKAQLYKHLADAGFGYLNTAYNMCAFLIIISPFVWLSKNQACKDFMTYVGTAAGAAAMFVPYWFIGQTHLGWEGFRFYVCHGLLFMSSILPVVLGLHKLSWRSWYKIAPLFFVGLCTILINNILCIAVGWVDGATMDNLYQTLYSQNPLGMMHPPEAFPFIEKILAPITPKAWLSDGKYVPILWYAWPIFVAISLAAFGITSAIDRKNFRQDMAVYKQNFVNFKDKCAKLFNKKSK